MQSVPAAITDARGSRAGVPDAAAPLQTQRDEVLSFRVKGRVKKKKKDWRKETFRLNGRCFSDLCWLDSQE